MRVFAAVELPEEVREAIAVAARGLLAGVRFAKLVHPENLHVTVRFLGEVEERGLDAVLAAARDAADATTASVVSVRGFGAFPNSRRPSVLWAGLNDPAAVIARLETEFASRADPLGFVREDRAFTPHVTVARLRDDRRRRVELQLDGSSPSFGALPVERLTIFASELSPRGSRYTALGRFPLQPTSPKEKP